MTRICYFHLRLHYQCSRKFQNRYFFCTSLLGNSSNSLLYVCNIGHRKCLDERGQAAELSLEPESSWGSGCAIGKTRGVSSAYQTDYRDHPNTEGTTSRRFPRNHLERSTVADAPQAGEHFIWFGRHDKGRPVPLVLAATNCSSSSKRFQILLLSQALDEHSIFCTSSLGKSQSHTLSV
ncbi:hypothetical protein DPEC_G00035310 [Dallia pectoralis]|uniref:Uncharacterized protein n=1 Tax=Dallia pectoralis TaxID=75939 RepID=A0ACC2HD94_DALPE|nr:hypothetical protein DPEC_G00035310 [Dallia pectoralis]